MKNFVPLLVVLLLNVWLWKLFAFSIILGILVTLTTILLYRSVLFSFSPYVVGILLMILLIFQYTTTKRTQLAYLDNDEQRIQQMRLREYPPIFIKFGSTTIWLKVAHWFEGRKESIAFAKIQKNFSESVDPNLYFFANHPRERVGTKEFEKFPYLLSPVFIFGILQLIKKKLSGLYWASCAVPLLFLSLIGNQNPLGPFSLFPFLAITIFYGLTQAYLQVKTYSKNSRYITTAFLIGMVVVYIQMLAYERF